MRTTLYPRAVILIFAVSAICSGCQAGANAQDENGIDFVTIETSGGEKSFAVDDVNNDSFPDLIVAEAETNRIVVFLNNGAGDLVRASHYSAGPNPTSITALDFDRDGNKDIAVANHDVQQLTLLRGDGTGGFSLGEQSPMLIETLPHSHMIASADFNSDGFRDIIVDSRDEQSVHILPGRSDGRFELPGERIGVEGAPYLGFSIADFDNDGTADLVTPNANDLSVMLNRSSEILSFERVTSIAHATPFFVIASDVTGDNNIDIIAASESAAQGISVYAGDSQGGFTKTTSFAIANGAKSMASGDANGDGIADIVVTSWNADIVLIVGGKEESSLLSLPTTSSQSPWGSAFGDFDRDGRDEIIVGDAASDRVMIYRLSSSAE